MSIASTPDRTTRWRALFIENRSTRLLEIFALACIVAYFLMAAAQLALLPPINDEAEYASPALTLWQSGKFATKLYEAIGGSVPGREEVVFYMLPGHPLTSIPIIAMFGPSLFALRVKSLLFMCAAAFLVYKILQSVGLPRPYPALATALVCLNRNWLQTSVISRPEPQAFLVGLAGAYLFSTSTRDRKPLGAVLGGALVGFAVISHINAILFGLFCLAVAARQIGRDFRNTSIYAGALGVLLPMAAYAAFAHAHPDQFRAQIGWNSNLWGRSYTWSHPIAGVFRELHRWAPLYWTLGSRPNQAIYALISAISLAAILILAVRRTESSRRLWIAPLYAFATAMAFALFNNVSIANYFFYRTFIADICVVALLAVFAGKEASKQRTWWALGVAAVFSFHLFRDFVFLRNSIHDSREYDALVRAMQANQGDEDYAIGPAELAFPRNFSPNYVVDENFGFYSGRHPNLIALYRDGDSRKTLIDAALGGACVGDVAGAEAYTSFAGPGIAAQLERDRDRLCPYLRDLSDNTTILYTNTRYQLLRVGRSGGG